METRRVFIKNTGLFTLSTMVFPFHASLANLPGDKVRIGIATDSHYADRDSGGTRYYRGALDKMREFVDVMNREKVDFVIHLGDFKDEDQTKDTKKTLSYLRKIELVYSGFKGPRYHCIGNHDVDSITKAQFLDNIENTDIPKGKSYYSFDLKGLHIIILDANFNKDGTDQYYLEGADWQDPNLTEEQLDWLEEDLKETKKATLVFCHHPLFEFHREGYRFHINEYERVQKLLESSTKVLAVLQGHVHEERQRTINGIHYITQNGMVDFQGLENNSFSILEIQDNSMKLHGYRRAKDIDL
ncbi:metallophosphoesterase family protein [Poritiphilus flavus]|uniref:Calcineurin-like phosphoesterase domain-containing protein n=1 Tax=Poritiphilus flavus TaxID=2697053 RepID=A0A6L9EH51_9FLAO|nr:metallophosphoesterase [Poritiphilus flavus]NAS13838.1 hypothetical protein [Poritiphilus flavus]